MPVLWLRDEDRRWAALLLEHQRPLLLSEPPPRWLRDAEAAADEAASGLVVAPAAGGPAWMLVWGPEEPVRINGLPVTTGVRVLSDRDEIHSPHVGSVFYSTEHVARIEPFPGADRPLHCARSKLPIQEGDPAVCCPGCGTWYLASEEHPAWTYGETCLFCPQPTNLDAGLRWSPEDA